MSVQSLPRKARLWLIGAASGVVLLLLLGGVLFWRLHGFGGSGAVERRGAAEGEPGAPGTGDEAAQSRASVGARGGSLARHDAGRGGRAADRADAGRRSVLARGAGHREVSPEAARLTILAQRTGPQSGGRQARRRLPWHGAGGPSG
jgi:hypothetical protein